MKSISVYDVEAKKIEKYCDEHSTTAAEVIEAMMTALEDEGIKLEDYI